MQSIWREIAYYGRVLKELVFPRRCVVCGYGIEAAMSVSIAAGIIFCSAC